MTKRLKMRSTGNVIGGPTVSEHDQAIAIDCGSRIMAKQIRTAIEDGMGDFSNEDAQWIVTHVRELCAEAAETLKWINARLIESRYGKFLVDHERWLKDHADKLRKLIS